MSQLPILFAFLLLAFIPCSTSLTSTFYFPSFTNAQDVTLSGDAFVNSNGNLELTITDRSQSMTGSTGWAVYNNNITLYDAGAGFSADFQSNFSLQLFSLGANCTGDGLAFFMAPDNWTHNAENGGYGLGIFNKISGANNSQMIAVEFDTFQNDFDPSANHMGIDIGSFNSSATVNWKPTVNNWGPSVENSLNAIALIQYNSTTGNLRTQLMDIDRSLQWSTSLDVDLSKVLPGTVVVGFSVS